MRRFVLLLLCAAVAPLQARLGETPAQLTQRFGPPLTVSQGRMIFRRDGFTVTAAGHNGICCEIVYKHTGDMPEATIRTLLSGNGEGTAWRPVKPTQYDLNSRTSRWTGAGGRLTAVHRGDTLTITDQAAMKARQKAAASASAEAAGRF